MSLIPFQPNVKNLGLVGLSLLFQLQTPTTGVWAPLHPNIPGPRDALSACLFTAHRPLCQASRGECPLTDRATSPVAFKLT